MSYGNNTDPLLIWSFMGAWAGLVLFLTALRKMKGQRYISETPSSKIKTMAMGLVEIQGTVRISIPLTAPLSGRPCACYKILAEVHVDKDIWRPVGQDSSAEPFEIQDETGKALVDPDGAEFEFARCTFTAEGAASRLPESCRNHLDRMGIRHADLALFKRIFRLREWSVPVNHPVFILGMATPPHSATYAGTLTRDPSGRPYLISEYSQKDLLQRLSARIHVGLLGGPLLFAAGLAYILYYCFAR